MIKVGIIGSTGYAGAELVRLLMGHKEAEIVWYGSRSYVDKRYADVYQNMFQIVDAKCLDDNMEELASQVDVIFTATPQGFCASVVNEAILAKTVIDCTGDGDVAFRAGVECNKGDENGGMQPPTLMFCMRGVETQKLRDAICNEPEKYDMDVMPTSQFQKDKFITVGLRGRILEALENGYKVPVARTILITGLAEDEIWVNMTRVSGVDATNPVSYTQGEHDARFQMYEVIAYLKDYVPGFKNSWLEHSAPFMGIRETRVIVGKYIMTSEDLLEARQFEDAIAVASYPIDLHHEEGGDCTLIYGKGSYDIPYRTLVPEKIEGLLVAGRCSSMDHGAMAATRVMSTVMAMGEAAGTAARIALECSVEPSEVDVKMVQQALIENGGYLR